MLASVLINNYNYADYLEQCVNSVLNQTYDSIEIIIYDDGSTDNSLEVLSQFNNIKVISNENYGKNHKLNQMNAVYQAFLQAKGDYIFLLDSDDWFKEDKVEKVINAFIHHPNVEVVQHSLEEVDKAGQSLHSIVPVLKEVTNYKNYLYETESLFHLFSTTSALAFKRRFFERIMPLQEDALSYLAVDIRLMIKAAIMSNICTLFEPLSYYRKHGTNDSNRLGDLNAHQNYTEELYSFFNATALEHNLPTISYSKLKFLETTFFFNQLNIEQCYNFIGNAQYWIWGAGEAGQSVAYALRTHKAALQGFIDSDSRKQDQVVMERRIFAPEDVDYNENTKIIVSSYHAFEAIKSMLLLKNMNEGLQFIDPYIRKD